MVDIYTPRAAPTPRAAGQVSRQPAQDLYRAGAAVQGVADQFSTYYEEKAADAAELVWTQAQVDLTRDFKERAKTAKDGFTQETLDNFDTYVEDAMTRIPPRQTDNMTQAFAKRRITLEGEALAKEAEARAVARAKQRAEIKNNRHTNALELIEGGFDPAEVFNVLRFSATGDVLKDEDQLALLEVITDNALMTGDRDGLNSLKTAMVEDNKYHEFTTAEQRVAVQGEIDRALTQVDYIARENAEKDIEAHIRSIKDGEPTDIDLIGSISELTPAKQETAIEDINVATNVQRISGNADHASEAELTSMLADVQPDKAETHVERRTRQDVEARVAEVREERKEQPAVAATNDPEVRAAWDAVSANPSSASWENYISLSLQHQKHRFNLAPGSEQAVPEPVAAQIADGIRTQLAAVEGENYAEMNKARNAVTSLIYAQASNQFGEYADEVLIQALSMIEATNEEGTSYALFTSSLEAVARGSTSAILTTPAPADPSAADTGFSGLSDEQKADMLLRARAIMQDMTPTAQEKFINNTADPVLRERLREQLSE